MTVKTPLQIIREAKQCFADINGTDDCARIKITKAQAKDIMRQLSGGIGILDLGDGNILLTSY